MTIVLYFLFLPNIFILIISLLAREWALFAAAIVAIFYNAVIIHLINEKEISDAKVRRFQETSDRRYNNIKSELDELKELIIKSK